MSESTPSPATPAEAEKRARTSAPHAYADVTDAHLDVLRGIVGEADLIRPTHERFERYCHDETEDLRFPPAVAVRPQTAEQVAEIIKLAHRERIPVTPWSAGTSLSGGALAIYGGIALSLERMNRIVEIDAENGFAIVEPGLVNQTLQDTVQPLGLYYPPDPASRGSCTIGGNIAMNSGGPRCVKYGVTKDYVMGVQAVLSTGDRVKFGGKRLKDVAGYNMPQFFVGSEGTLGIVTQATLKLIPSPPLRRLLLVPFDDVKKCAACVAKIFHTRITPSACEFLERRAIEAAAALMGAEWPSMASCEAQLLIELDGFDDARLDAEIEIVGEACIAAGATDVMVAATEGKQRELWAMRRAVAEAVKQLSTYKGEDTCVPRMRLPDLVLGVREICGRYGIRVICYGHAGDGNLHCNLLRDALSDEAWRIEVPKAIREIFTLTVALGGTITGEHGVGYVQRDYLPIAQSPVEIAAQWAIKRAWDPHGILNPGKLFPSNISDFVSSIDWVR